MHIILNRLSTLKIETTSCKFHNNKYALTLAADCFSPDLIYCILLLIKNTTLSCNLHFEGSLVYIYLTTVKIDQVKITSNFEPHGAIFVASESYLQFNSYNEISNNTLDVEIYV